MPKMLELQGLQFGRLKVINKNGSLWNCECCCSGKIVQVSSSYLNAGLVRSCGCLKKEMDVINLSKGSSIKEMIGQSFGRWIVVDKGYKKDRTWYWIVQCSCDNKTIKTVSGKSLRYGQSKSCGCVKREIIITRNKSLVGEKSPVWNFNKSIEEKEKNKSRINIPGYKEWIYSVFQRDNFQCVICGHKGDIQSHHLNGFGAFPDQRIDVDNGVTLCCSNKIKNYNGCHELFHNQYGRGNNTKEQFEEFRKQYQENNNEE